MKLNFVLQCCSFLFLCSCAAPRVSGKAGDPPSADPAVDRTLTSFRSASWTREWIDESYAYAVFPGIGKGGAGFGGALGSGLVYEQGKLVGSATTTQFTFGLQIGGQVYIGIILFRDKPALEAFQQGDFSITGQASGVFAFWGLSVDVILADGITVITRRPIGFMYEASFGGMIFRYRSI